MYKFDNLDQLLDDLHKLKASRRTEIVKKGKRFFVQGTSDSFKGLEAADSSYFFHKRDSFWNPGTILEQERDHFVVLSTDQTKSAHDVVKLLPVPHVVIGFQEVETGTDPITDKPIYQLQESHRLLPCNFQQDSVKFFEFQAPYLNTIIRSGSGSNYYRIISAKTVDMVTTCKVVPYEVRNER